MNEFCLKIKPKSSSQVFVLRSSKRRVFFVFKLCFVPELHLSVTRLMKSFSPAAFCNAPLSSAVSCLQQIDYLISQYATAKNKVIYDLDSK